MSKEKIRALFYSLESKNRALAFELAKSQNCYEEVIEELYNEWIVYPFFKKNEEYNEEYIQELLDEDPEFEEPKGIERKRFHLEMIAEDYFYHDLNFSGRHIEQKFENFPLPILNCTFATSLNLSWHKLKSIPEGIEQLSNLKKLDLACNHDLKNLPAGLGKLTELEELSLYGIQGVFYKKKYKDENKEYFDELNVFPDCFRHLKNLRKIHLGDVILDGFPEWIDELKSLEEIDIFSGWGSYPGLDLPSSFTNLTQLKELYINSYTVSIPHDIDKLKNLEHLCVQPAIYIPSTIKNLKNLKTLDFSYFSSDYSIDYEGYGVKWDLYNQGFPEGVSRLTLYGWEWLKEMTWLEQFTYVDIDGYAFTDLEKEELVIALPNCTFIFEERH